MRRADAILSVHTTDALITTICPGPVQIAFLSKILDSLAGTPHDLLSLIIRKSNNLMVRSRTTIKDSPQANGTVDRRRGAGGGGGRRLLTLLGRVVRSEQRRRVCRGLLPPAPGTLAPLRLRGGGGEPMLRCRGVGKEAAAVEEAAGGWGRRPPGGLCDGRGLGQRGIEACAWARVRAIGKKLGRLRYLAKCKLCVAHYAQYAPRILDT
jgi:hypothetical protein